MKLSTLGKESVHASDILHYVESPFYVWCDYHAPSEERDEMTKHVEMLLAQGAVHEKNLVEANHPGLEPVHMETTEEIMELLKQGPAVIAQCTLALEKERLLGRSDLLERVETPSELGKYSYVVKEIKSAKNIRKKHVLQAAFYNYLLGELQGYTPRVFYVINAENEEFPFPYEDYAAEMHHAIKKSREIRKGAEVLPVYGINWPWNAYSKKRAIETSDVTLVTGVGESKRAPLNEAQYRTLQDLAKAKVEDLTAIKGVGPSTARNIIHGAQALVQEKVIVLKKPELPKHAVEMYFDLEGTMPGDAEDVVGHVDYLFGVLVDEPGKATYFKAFVAHTPQEEEKAFRELLAFLNGFEDYVLYHFASYEKTHMKRLKEQYAIETDIVEHLVDLQKALKGHVFFPTYGQGLKPIAKYLGYTWKHADVDATESMAMYQQYTENKDEELLQKIIDYNEDDVRATKVVREWCG